MDFKNRALGPNRILAPGKQTQKFEKGNFYITTGLWGKIYGPCLKRCSTFSDQRRRSAFLEVHGSEKSFFGPKSNVRTRKAGPEIRKENEYGTLTKTFGVETTALA